METDVPAVKIEAALASVIGEADEGTRIYRAVGDDEACRRWTDALFRHFPHGVVSPGGAGRYAGVSRPAVHKAMHEGRLTAFLFHIKKDVKTFFGKRMKMRTPYVYVPVDELKAWRQVLNERASRVMEQGVLSGTRVDHRETSNAIHREIEGPKPDWNAEFLDQPPKKPARRKK